MVVKPIKSCLRKPFRNDLTHSVNTAKLNYNTHACKDPSEDKVGGEKFAVMLWNASPRVKQSSASNWVLSTDCVWRLQGSSVRTEDLCCSSTQSDSGGHVGAVLRSACHHEGPRLMRQKKGRHLGSIDMVISVKKDLSLDLFTCFWKCRYFSR